MNVLGLRQAATGLSGLNKRKVLSFSGQAAIPGSRCGLRGFFWGCEGDSALGHSPWLVNDCLLLVSTHLLFVGFFVSTLPLVQGQ